MENIAHVIELWTKIPASKIREEEFQRLSRAGAAPQAPHRRRAGRSHCGGVCRRAAEPGGYLSQAQAGELHLRRPTGVGKTELVKQLAVDLFNAPESADPAGYVRVYGEALRLSDRRQPAGLCGL